MYETKKLYYEDVYKKEFTAKVLECRQGKKGYEVILDQTAFYPEGGGQPCDLGTINGISVVDVQEKGSEIVHYTESLLSGRRRTARRYRFLRRGSSHRRSREERRADPLHRPCSGTRNGSSGPD